jgi:hypothetical protein
MSNSSPCITNWFGRLGNNIQQISNAIYYCQKNNINFTCPKHEHINSFSIDFGKDTYLSNRFFFFNGNSKDFNCIEWEVNSRRKNICEQYILPNIKIQPKEIVGDDTIVIHIRSGDIFRPGGWHKLYTQNPLWYFQNIINKYEKTIIVTDIKDPNLLNPVIPHLVQNKKVTIQSQTVQDDFATLLSARNLCCSGVGTFCVAAALCSNNLKKFYSSTIYWPEQLNPTMLYHCNIDIEITHIKNYIKVGEWVNSPEQVDLIINHKQ